MNYIVITTISEPTEATLKYLTFEDWRVVIVGDQKTPHTSYETLEKERSNLKYFHPDEQVKMFPDLSEAVGWNLSPRRNLGYAYAYCMDAQVLASVDDDNVPYDNWGQDLLVGKMTEVDVFFTGEPVSDPLKITMPESPLWHRGFPIQLVPKRNVKHVGKVKMNPLVQVSFWDGDPDLDAMERLIYAPKDITIPHLEPFTVNNIAPFNSKNTFFSRPVIPYYILIPAAGRVDDIW